MPVCMHECMYIRDLQWHRYPLLVRCLPLHVLLWCAVCPNADKIAKLNDDIQGGLDRHEVQAKVAQKLDRKATKLDGTLV